MGAFADHSLHDLLDAVAAQRPAPGGGCSAAWAASMGAGLVEMAASFTLARPRYAGVHRRMLDVRKDATGLRRRLVELADSDAESYEAVVAAMRLPAKHPERRQLLDDARSQAAETPMAIAEAAADVAELAAEAARDGNEHLEGDAVTGVLLAEGACRAAARLVEINLADQPDDPRLPRVAAAVRRAGAAREGALPVRQESVA
ncbi:MAG: glutamate formiminotransferase / formiminotetrahydrofolate cyclodeaminase [Solirubrobacteraceae bacterium]|nr:glutamate formiminotransferase / formiminotetrahydrofolate cyclodeaminase [Solirubrobacteraceae bacterium]